MYVYHLVLIIITKGFIFSSLQQPIHIAQLMHVCHAYVLNNLACYHSINLITLYKVIVHCREIL